MKGTSSQCRGCATYLRQTGGGPTQAKLFSEFATTETMVNRNDLASLKKWSTMQFEAQILVAKGEKLNVGKVAPVLGYKGGADQVLLPRNFPENWVQSIKDLKTGKSYTLEQFKSEFPQHLKK